MVLLQHVCVLTWSITGRVCAGYGLLQHVCVLSWSITLNYYTLQYERMPTWLIAACVCALISTSVC